MLKPLKTVFGLLRQLIRFPPEYCTKRLFCFLVNRQGALADGLHGLNPRITAHRYTPVQKANSVDCATVKATGTTVETRPDV
jgi:hypothetical protein